MITEDLKYKMYRGFISYGLLSVGSGENGGWYT